MKKILSIIPIAVLCLVTVNAQERNRQIKKQDLGVKEMNVEGVKVIFKPSVKDIISVGLYIRGGTANYSKDQEGIESLTMAVLAESGSSKYTHEKFHEMLETYGTNIGAASTVDMSKVEMTCLRSRWNESWNIFADMVTSPAFDEQSFTNKKEEAMNYLKQVESNPDGHLEEMVYASVFANTNYSKKVDGSEASLSKIMLEDLKKYYTNLVNKNKLFVVIIGNIPEEDVKAKVSMLKGIPVGTPPAEGASARADFSKTDLFREDRKLATNYIQGVFNAPLPNEPDFIAMKIATQILSDRLFVEIRTKRNLSYAPYAFMTNMKNPYTAMYVSTTDPEQSVTVMKNLVDSIRTHGFSETELKNKKEKYVTSYYMNLETNAALNNTLGTNENLATWKNSLTVLEQVQKLSLRDINDAFKKYSENIRWVYLGDTEGLKEDVFVN